MNLQDLSKKTLRCIKGFISDLYVKDGQIFFVKRDAKSLESVPIPKYNKYDLCELAANINA